MAYRRVGCGACNGTGRITWIGSAADDPHSPWKNTFCGACNGSGRQNEWGPDPNPSTPVLGLGTDQADAVAHAIAPPRNRHRWFAAIDAWFERRFPQR